MTLKVGFIERAIEEARQTSSDMKAYHGAVIFKGSRLLGAGHNEKRHVGFIPEKYIDYKHSLHAELAAIRDVGNWDSLVGVHILVVRIDSEGNFREACPCEFCTDSLQHFRLSKCYYTTNDGRIEVEKVKDL